MIMKEEEKMQVENLEKPKIFDFQKMTCRTEMEEESSPSLDDRNAELTENIPNDDEKFEGINLEDDIEKVEVSSPETSSITTDSSEEDEDYDDMTLSNFEEFQKNYSNDEEFKNWLIKIKEMQNTIYKKIQSGNKKNITPSASSNLITPPTAATSRVMKYQDLPYMGEITLENSKPRRGRKPKKADICHLIYKNYGTILPGTPNPDDYITDNLKKSSSSCADSLNTNSGSLLEKRLMTTPQEQNKKIKFPKKNGKINNNEPMNLCVRDLHQLKIKLKKNPNDDTYSTQIKSEPKNDIESDNLNDEYGVPQFLMKNYSNMENYPFFQTPERPLLQEQFNIYYQKLANLNNTPRPPPDIIPIEKKSRKPIKIKPKSTESKNIEKSNNSKRKRSAIFIPPIPTENNTSPATEVSICKFKFTGGAKPSLQEKKMLSVDSGGNFRYYSGTGDKSMRGYEFFPRETLQQTANATQCSSTGAFLQASGEKFYPINENDEKQVKSEFLLSPDLPSSSSSAASINATPPFSYQHHLDLKHKKRKSRKSLQREKLEKTFKEKGFLIQTQQLESAEGATYCKFRQLRKFTRYLFRSWKDYLPGNVQQDNPENLRTHNLENLMETT